MGFVSQCLYAREKDRAERDALGDDERTLLQEQYKTIGEGGQVYQDPLTDYVLVDTGMCGDAFFLKKLHDIQEKIAGKKGQLALLVVNYTKRRFRSYEFAVGFQWLTSEHQKYIVGFLEDDQLHINYSGDFSHGPEWLLADEDAFGIMMMQSVHQEWPYAQLFFPFGLYGPKSECSHKGSCSTEQGLCYGDYDIGRKVRQGDVHKVVVGEERVREYFVNAGEESLFEKMHALLHQKDTTA